MSKAAFVKEVWTPEQAEQMEEIITVAAECSAAAMERGETEEAGKLALANRRLRRLADIMNKAVKEE